MAFFFYSEHTGCLGTKGALILGQHECVFSRGSPSHLVASGNEKEGPPQEKICSTPNVHFNLRISQRTSLSTSHPPPRPPRPHRPHRPPRRQRRSPRRGAALPEGEVQLQLAGPDARRGRPRAPNGARGRRHERWGRIWRASGHLFSQKTRARWFWGLGKDPEKLIKTRWWGGGIAGAMRIHPRFTCGWWLKGKSETALQCKCAYHFHGPIAWDSEQRPEGTRAGSAAGASPERRRIV